MSKSAYDFTLYGPDTQQLYQEAQKFERIVARLPGLLDVNSDLQIKNPRINIAIDRDRAAALELNWIEHREHALRCLRPAVLLHHLLPHQPVPRAARNAAGVPAARRRALAMIYLKSGTGKLVPLDAVAKLTSDAGPQSIPTPASCPR